MQLGVTFIEITWFERLKILGAKLKIATMIATFDFCFLFDFVVLYFVFDYKSKANGFNLTQKKKLHKMYSVKY